MILINTDDVKDYLSKVRYIDEEIDAKEEVRERMRQRLVNVQATQYREIDVQGGIRKTDEDRIIEYMEYSEQINEMIDDLIDLKMEVIGKIENIDNGLYRTLLTERYINNKGWDVVADLIGYSPRRTMEHHNDALREYAKANKVRT